jgi:hypothetical protein
MKPSFLTSCSLVVLGLAISGQARAQDWYEYAYDFGEACG